MFARVIPIVALLCCSLTSRGQHLDSSRQDGAAVSVGYLRDIESKATSLGRKIQSTSVKKLRKLRKLDTQILNQYQGRNGVVSRDYISEVEEKYSQLSRFIQEKSEYAGMVSSVNYVAELDRLKTTVGFLGSEGRTLISDGKDIQEKLNASLSKLTELQNLTKHAASVDAFLKEREQWLKRIDRADVHSKIVKLSREMYYYREQLRTYREALKDPKLMQSRAYEVIRKVPAFQKYFSKYSELAMLFPQPDSYGTPSALEGLQTREQMQQLLQSKMGSGNGFSSNQTMQQGLGIAQSQLHQLKDKVLQLGGSSSDVNMPDYRINPGRTKSFMERLEFGFNVQNTRAGSIFPVTTDFGASVGYKFSRNGIAGLGASYKVGWGKSIKEISITQEGVGLRGYIDWRIKGDIYISGGYEQNYFSQFDNLGQLSDFSSWRQSGLLGLSKRYSIGKKWKGDVKLLWDFLSYRSVPQSQHFLFRFGYQLK